MSCMDRASTAVGLAVVSALMIATLLPSPAQAIAPQSDAQVPLLYARAERLFRSGDQEGALPVLDRLIERLDGLADEVPREYRLLLLRSLTYRAIGRWNSRQRDALDAELDRIVDLDPTFELDDQVAPEALVARFVRRRERRVGYLTIGVFPADARVSVDGQRIDPIPDVLPVLAGDHVVVAVRTGFAPGREEVSVRANRTAGVGVQLERANATIRLATDPAGAMVFVDGDLVGMTTTEAGAESEQASIVVEGLLPGSHDLEVTLADHRTFRQRVDVPNLADYDLGLVQLQRSLGRVVLRGLPSDARVLIDGQKQDPEPGAAVGRMVLPVGLHQLSITATGVGVYEADLIVEDGGTHSFDVRLRPGIVLLGVLGGDALDRDAVLSTLRRRLGGLDNWFLLDRSSEDRIGDVARLRPGTLAKASAADIAGSLDWEQLRSPVGDEVPGSLFVLATVPAAAPSGSLDLWLWPAAQGPIPPKAVRMTLDDIGQFDQLTARLQTPLPPAREWFGATLMDSSLSGRPTVAALAAGGPAAASGLQVGDEVLAVDGVAVERVSDVTAKVHASVPFAAMSLQYGRGSDIGTVRVTMGSSPQVVRVGDSANVLPIVWAAAAQASAHDSNTPGWVLRLDQAMILLQAGEWRRAAEMLERTDGPDNAPFGQAAVDYWLGVALSSSATPDVPAARAALQRAASQEGGRLYHRDGPLVAPRARARLAQLEVLSEAR